MKLLPGTLLTKRQVHNLLLTLALLMAGFAGQARAEFKLTDRLTIAPNLYVAEEYTDNLLLAADHEEDDFLTTVFPSIRLKYSTKYLFVDETYGHEFIDYKDHSEYDQTSFEDTQRSSAYAQIFPGNAFNIDLRHNLSRSNYGDRNTFNEENDLVNKTRVTTYSINPKYLYDEIQTFRAWADYLYQDVDYDEFGDDWKQHQATLRMEKDLNAREDKLRGELQGARIERENSEEYERVHVKVGGLLHLGPYWFLEGSIGRARVYPSVGDNIDITIGDIYINYDRAAVHARAGYAVTYPFVGDYNEAAYKTEILEAGLVIKKRAVLGLHARATRDHYFDQRDPDDTFRSTVKLDVPVNKRVWVSVTGDWSVYEYGSGQETYYRYGGGVGIFRTFRWGEGGMQYYYNARASDHDSRDYEQNYVRLYVNIPF